MAKKQNDQGKKSLIDLVLGFALLFLAVILAINAVQKVQSAAIFSAVIGFCGTVLFGGVSVVLLLGELRRWQKKRK